MKGQRFFTSWRNFSPNSRSSWIVMAGTGGGAEKEIRNMRTRIQTILAQTHFDLGIMSYFTLL
jgi:hypothetical protein